MKQSDVNAEAAAISVKCGLAGDVLRSFGSLRFAATGWSMLPTVWPGDTLVVERACKKEVHLGDIVLVGREGRLCAHRVVGTSGDPENPQWITQGDGMLSPDRPVAADELLGRVAYLVRAGRLVAVPSKLNVVQTVFAKVVRRSFFAARALVYLNRIRQTSSESVLPCRD